MSFNYTYKEGFIEYRWKRRKLHYVNLVYMYIWNQTTEYIQYRIEAEVLGNEPYQPTPPFRNDLYCRQVKTRACLGKG